MIVALFAGIDQFGHHGADHQRIFVLIAARTDGHVETFHVGLVINGNPVVGTIIQIADPAGLVGYLHAGHPLGAAVGLGFPLGFGKLVVPSGPAFAGVKLVRIDPLLRIAFRIFTADQKHVADFRTVITGNVTVRGVVAVTQVIVSFRRRAVHHLVPQGLGFDVAALIDPFGHLIDFVRMRAGRIDDHRCIDLGSVFKRYALYLVVLTSDGNDLGVEHKFSALGFRRPHNVVSGQGRVVNITAFGAKQRALEHFLRLIKKFRILGPSDGPVFVHIINRDHFFDFIVVPLFIGNTDGIVVFFDLAPVVPLRFDQNGAGVHILGQAFFVVDMLQVIFPFQPVFKSLVSHGHTVFGGIMGPHDGAGCRGGAFAGICQLVDVQGLVTHLGQFIGDGNTDDTCSDNDGIVFFLHD